MSSGLRTSLPLRASSLRDCPRKAVFEATKAPRRERTEREEKTLFRGKRIGQDYIVMFASSRHLTIWADSGPYHWIPPNLRAENAAAAGVVAEKKIQWEFGVGHADGLVVDTGTVIEVLSSNNASAEMVHSKTLQCVLYMEHEPLAKAGAVVVVSPTDLSEEVFPIAKTSKVYGELVEEMRERITQVRNWSESGIVPGRVCSKPNDAIGHFCLHAEHCFQDWEPPVLPDLTDDTTRDLVTQLYRAKQGEREHKAALAIAETDRKEIEQRLDDLVPVGKHRVGSLEVTRTHVQRGPTVDLKKAALAGFPVDSLAEFEKPGASYDTFRVDRVSDAPVDDFGDEAPWSSVDLDAA